jgi:hypothetical protein
MVFSSHFSAARADRAGFDSANGNDIADISGFRKIFAFEKFGAKESGSLFPA